jgi:predicted nucleotidyltransferase
LHVADAVQQRLALIDAAVYADLFDCAVTERELWHYSRLPLERGELRRRIAEDGALRGALTERDGLYCLAGREKLLDLRPERRRQARRLQARARRVARVLRHIPFVRALLLTGSAAADDAAPGADVDLLVIVRHGRLATVFTLLGTLSRLLSRRLLCPNYYLSDAHLGLDGRDPYHARELVQSMSLAGDANALYEANEWARSVYPNASTRDASVPPGSRLQRIAERPLGGRLGDSLDSALRALAQSRLAKHYALWGSSVPRGVRQDFEAGIRLRFHGSPANQSVLARYERRRSEIAACLGRRSGRQGERAAL